ncbi:hypothetical protein GO988_11815 [Hymenobacter sp. HMF4947]|uniref:Uncharacterized protein n=1 Tax=Hymenobacter ginkgonis TaxID=2682976 RepID=A0A7K1TF24_9BACT|nr:hypothetical protein [Hymenobacter ginkgonis]MVN77013.1 hypothetical protein [Hymenobacter ginkgonis]
MLRPFLTLLLLLNYLLVVGVGLLVSRPPEPRYTAAHPYVHSPQCQQQHYLRLDCFEHCNGDQHEIRHRPTGTGLHYLAQLKGLDVHFPTPPVAALLATCAWQPAPRHPAPTHLALPLGQGGRDYPPPQRG